jgi:hypothetical protein
MFKMFIHITAFISVGQRILKRRSASTLEIMMVVNKSIVHDFRGPTREVFLAVNPPTQLTTKPRALLF